MLLLVLSGRGFPGKFDCIIEPSKTVEVRAVSEGLIEKIWVDRGDRVKVGQVLVTLDSGVERAATESARYRSTRQGKIRTDLIDKSALSFHCSGSCQMKGNGLYFRELSANQLRVSRDAKQTYEAYRDARRNADRYSGGLTWKNVGGRDHLIRIINRRGGTSCGMHAPS